MRPILPWEVHRHSPTSLNKLQRSLLRPSEQLSTRRLPCSFLMFPTSHMYSNKLYTPLRYPGGKASFAPFIAQLMDQNGLSGGHYLEPYAGSAVDYEPNASWIICE